MNTAPGGIGPVDTTRRVPLRIVDYTDRADAAPGDAMVLVGHDGAMTGYAFRCPGCGVENYLPLRAMTDRPHAPKWDVTAGDPYTAAGLTLSPSIYHEAPRGCGWHGWLHNGVLSPC